MDVGSNFIQSAIYRLWWVQKLSWLDHCVPKIASQIRGIQFRICVGSDEEFYSLPCQGPRPIKITSIKNIRTSKHRDQTDLEIVRVNQDNKWVYPVAIFKNQIIIRHVGVTCSQICSFYGSKGEKVRSIDLSSRVRRFVYDSKTTVAIVNEIILFRLNRKINAPMPSCTAAMVRKWVTKG